MIDQLTIERIVAEVLKAINIPLELSEPAELKSNLVIVKAGNKIDSKMIALLEAKWNLYFFEFVNDQIPNSKEKIVFLDASQDLLIKGALGLTDSRESFLLSQLIMANVPVTFIPSAPLEKLLNEDWGMINQEYQALLLRYKEALKKFGVEIVPLEMFLQISDVKRNNSCNRVSFHSKVLTQRDIQMFSGNKITINNKTIVTPLARDAAKELGKIIEIINNK
ncbi:MAG TPA: hypothetical protein VJ546_06560 [Bacillales bacterium]|nr:hypothetical protein [Bacillales bacterium]